MSVARNEAQYQLLDVSADGKWGELKIYKKDFDTNSPIGGVEFTLTKNDTTFVNMLCETQGVTNAVLVSYNGDYTG